LLDYQAKYIEDIVIAGWLARKDTHALKGLVIVDKFREWLFSQLKFWGNTNATPKQKVVLRAAGHSATKVDSLCAGEAQDLVSEVRSQKPLTLPPFEKGKESLVSRVPLYPVEWEPRIFHLVHGDITKKEVQKQLIGKGKNEVAGAYRLLCSYGLTSDGGEMKVQDEVAELRNRVASLDDKLDRVLEAASDNKAATQKGKGPVLKETTDEEAIDFSALQTKAFKLLNEYDDEVRTGKEKGKACPYLASKLKLPSASLQAFAAASMAPFYLHGKIGRPDTSHETSREAAEWLAGNLPLVVSTSKLVHKAQKAKKLSSGPLAQLCAQESDNPRLESFMQEVLPRFNGLDWTSFDKSFDGQLHTLYTLLYLHMLGWPVASALVKTTAKIRSEESIIKMVVSIRSAVAVLKAGGK
jgi:hypothetical protein